MPRVIHTGQALVDATVNVPDLPQRGQNVIASSYAQAAGGAVNILVAAARQGATCVHAAAIGTGPNGDLIRAALDAEGVTYSAPAVPDQDTGVCIVMVDADAQRTFVTTQMAERHPTIEGLQTSEPQPGDLVCVTGYSLESASTRDPLLAWLEGLPAGVLVVLDPGAPFAALPADLRSRMLAITDVWTGNQEESTALCGVEGMDAAASEIVRMLPADAVAIVRDGEHGCAVATASGVEVVEGFPQKAVDTNGAGDAHTGVLVAARCAGVAWVEAARRANAGAAIKVTRKGPATAPTASEIDGFLARQEH